MPFEKAVSRYKKRRTDLLSKLKDCCLIQGVDKPFNQHNPWLNRSKNLYQDPSFLYLTGINQEHTAILLNPYTKKIHLFLPLLNEHKVFWEGLFLGIHETNPKHQEALCNSLGFDSVSAIDRSYDSLIKQIKDAKQTRCSTFFYEAPNKQSPIMDHSTLKKIELENYLKKDSIQITSCEPLLQDRPVLDKHDIDLMNQANNHTAKAFILCLQQFKTLKNENDVAGLLIAEAYKSSFLGESFAPIVAQGKNACILHYNKNNAPLEPGNLLLLDFGCRAHSIPADISRTIPINGKFNPLQALLYNIVLSAQSIVEKNAKAGIMIHDLNLRCWNHIESELQKKFQGPSAKIQRPYKERPHNVSHLIGHIVHDGDPYRNYYNEGLKSGQVISNEPGIYGYFELEINGILYKEQCGIRIEDNLLITETGCKNLSQNCPKTIADIEALLR